VGNLPEFKGHVALECEHFGMFMMSLSEPNMCDSVFNTFLADEQKWGSERLAEVRHR
jgi:hypothetical protein